jgi:predicted DNA-binding transcriptional regulator
MDALRNLLEEIKQLQLLVCLHRQNRTETQRELTLHEVSGQLHISPEECGAVARRLIDKGWIENVPVRAASPAPQLRLTREGISQLHSWAGSSNRREEQTQTA